MTYSTDCACFQLHRCTVDFDAVRDKWRLQCVECGRKTRWCDSLQGALDALKKDNDKLKGEGYDCE